jgi:hypothetical protein
MRETIETPDVDAPQVPVTEPDMDPDEQNDDNDENGENDTPGARYDGGEIPTS